MRHYTVNYQATEDDGSIKVWSSSASFNSSHDKSEELVKEYSDFHKDDPNFKVISVSNKNYGVIDYDLSERMKAVRDMCELGHKVRAEVNIRNRQPLRNLYVLFSNKRIQDYMVYLDGLKKDYANIFSQELNVFNVEFVESVDKFFNYNLKPNFRTLGPKGFGKQAQALKGHLAALPVEEKNALYEKLKTETVEVMGIPLTATDIELEYIPKAGYFAATGKIGAIVLDTKLDSSLIEKGFIADFRSALQGVRKLAELDLTDRVYLEVFANDNVDVLRKYSDKLKKDLLANEIVFLPFEKINVMAHRFDIGKQTFYVNLYKIENKAEA